MTTAEKIDTLTKHYGRLTAPDHYSMPILSDILKAFSALPADSKITRDDWVLINQFPWVWDCDQPHLDGQTAAKIDFCYKVLIESK
jgi:hypothetical protein